MFINLSNHPSVNWTAEQKAAATAIPMGTDTIADVAFPQIHPAADTGEVRQLAKDTFFSLYEKYKSAFFVVHVMGESGFVCAFVQIARAMAIPCYHSTTERISTEKDGVKSSIFRFVQFRQY